MSSVSTAERNAMFHISGTATGRPVLVVIVTCAAAPPVAGVYAVGIYVATVTSGPSDRTNKDDVISDELRVAGTQFEAVSPSAGWGYWGGGSEAPICPFLTS